MRLQHAAHLHAWCLSRQETPQEAPLPSKGLCSSPPYSEPSPKYGAAPDGCREPDRNGLGALVVLEGTTAKSPLMIVWESTRF